MNELPSNNGHTGHSENNQLATREAIDLMAPTDRFGATSRLYVKLHRQQLHEESRCRPETVSWRHQVKRFPGRKLIVFGMAVMTVIGW